MQVNVIFIEGARARLYSYLFNRELIIALFLVSNDSTCTEIYGQYKSDNNNN